MTMPGIAGSGLSVPPGRLRLAWAGGAIEKSPDSARTELCGIFDVLLEYARDPNPHIRASAEKLLRELTLVSSSEIHARFHDLQQCVSEADKLGPHVAAAPRAFGSEFLLKVAGLVVGSGGLLGVLMNHIRDRGAVDDAQAVERVPQDQVTTALHWIAGNMTVRDLAAERTAHAIHVVVLVLMLLLVCSQYSSPRTAIGDSTVELAVKQFRRGLVALFASWTGLYAILLVDVVMLSYQRMPITYEVGAWAAADILNAVSSGALLYAFCVLDKPAHPSLDRSAEERAFRQAVLCWWGAAGTVGLLSALSRFGLLGEVAPWTFANSLFAGLALAYLVGRLNSHWMGLPRVVLLPLYAYALLQVPYMALSELSSGFRIVFFVLALALKLLLLGVVVHATREGHMVRFFTQAIAWHRSQSAPGGTS